MAQAASQVTELHAAVKRGDLAAMKELLDKNRALANARSETDPRGTYALHVACEAGQTAAAQLLLDYGADLGLLDIENNSIALCWAAFFGRPEIAKAMVAAGSDLNQRNKHGLTPLGCAVGGARGQWQRFSNATLEDWRKTAEIIRAHGGVE
jgi:ankyrin repeat protein